MSTQVQHNNIISLPKQLLAQVLQHVELSDRLHYCARVCSAWHLASIMATSSIKQATRFMGQAGSKALSVWLQAYAADANIDSIVVRGVRPSHTALTLPVQQLALLRKLDLADLTVTLQDSDLQDSSAQLPTALLGLTCLAVQRCSMQLSMLPALTGLQHLVLACKMGEDASAEVAVLAAALPNMQHLTFLESGVGYAEDAAVVGVQHLPNLRELLLSDSSCTAASFAALPAPLTKLCIEGSHELRQPEVQLLLSPSSTPGPTQLTALQQVLRNVDGFSAALLSSMPGLQHLMMEDTQLIDEGPEGVGLSVLSRLTSLTHCTCVCRQ